MADAPAMPPHDLATTLASPAVVTTITAVGIVLVLLLVRELPKVPRPLLVLMAAAFVDMLGVFLVVPLLPFYCQRLGADAALFGHPLGIGEVTGLVMATFTIAQSLSAPFWGRFSDRFGRRPALLVALAASAAGYLVFGIADSLWLLLLSRFVQGAGGGTVGVIQAYVADAVPPTERAKALGWLSAATNLGVALGPVLGSATLALGRLDLWPGDGELQLGGAAPGVAAAAICVANLLLVVRWLVETHTQRGAKAPQRAWPAFVAVVRQPTTPIARLLVLYGIAIGAGQGVNAVLALLLNANFAIGEGQIGIVYTWFGAVAVFARVLVLPRLVDLLGEVRLSRVGTVVLAAGLIAQPFVGSLGSLAIAVALIPLGMALLFPCVSALLSQVVPPAERGMYLGLQQTFGGFSRMLAPLAYGALYERLGHGHPFVVAGVVVLLTLPLGFGLGGAPRPAAGSRGGPAG